MELRTLRYFLAAAQEENITKAAEILHLTQPTLSRQILDLERELGVTLMLRGKNGLTLTDDGIFFRQRAQEIVELADRLEKDFAGRQNDISGMVDIGASEVAGSQTLAKLIQRVLRKISRGAVHPFTTKRWTYQRPSGERGWWTSACCWNPSM